jgi:hypothetical protein
MTQISFASLPALFHWSLQKAWLIFLLQRHSKVADMNEEWRRYLVLKEG